jgi:hypothetical protein
MTDDLLAARRRLVEQRDEAQRVADRASDTFERARADYEIAIARLTAFNEALGAMPDPAEISDKTGRAVRGEIPRAALDFIGVSGRAVLATDIAAATSHNISSVRKALRALVRDNKIVLSGEHYTLPTRPKLAIAAGADLPEETQGAAQ